MWTDPIVAEVRAIREKIFASYGYDLERMMKDVMKRQYESGRDLIPVPSEETETPAAASDADDTVESRKAS